MARLLAATLALLSALVLAGPASATLHLTAFASGEVDSIYGFGVEQYELAEALDGEIVPARTAQTVCCRFHVQQEPFKRLLNALRMDNCWVKISGAERISSAGPPFTDAVPFVHAVAEAAPDRVLWGTDWPHPNLKDHMPDDGLLVDFIPHIAPTAELQKKLLVTNPMRLYWPEEY